MLTKIEREIRASEADRLRRLAIDIVEGEEFPLRSSSDDGYNRITQDDFQAWREKVVKLLEGRLQIVG